MANTKYIRPPFFIGQLNAAAPDSTLTIVYVVVFVYLFIISANMWGDNFALNVTPILCDTHIIYDKIVYYKIKSNTANKN